MSESTTPAWLADGGEMGAMIRARDWSSTPLGNNAHWSPAFCAALSLLLSHPLPMLLWVGDAALHLYNDAFQRIAPEKHPDALGAPGAQVWGDIWDFLGPQARRILNGSPALTNNHLYLGLRRVDGIGRIFDISYVPVADETKHVVAVLVTLQESAPLIHEVPTPERVASALTGRAEADLRESEERLRIAIQAANIFIWEVDAATNYVTYSPNVEQVLGFPLESLASINRPLIHPDDRAHSLETYRRALKGEGEYISEYRFVEPVSGQAVWVRAAGTLIRDAHGNPARLIGVTQNITERKRRERNTEFLADVTADIARLSRPSEIMQVLDAKISRYMDGARVFFFSLNDNADYVTLLYDSGSEGEEPGAPLTYRPTDFLSDDLLNALREGEIVVIPDIHRDPRTVGIASAYTPYNVQSFLDIPYCADKRWRYMVTVAHTTPYQWRTDEIETLREVAARVWLRVESARAEESRFQSEARFRLAAEAARMYSWEIDLAARTVHFSENAARLLGYERMPTTWEGARELLYEQDRAMIGESFLRALNDTGALAIEFRHITASGDLLWFELRGIVIPATNHESARFMGIGQNITVRKQNEAALREMNETLEQRVRTRTRQVQDLAAALTLAEQEERQRVAGILHDDLQQRLYSLLVRLQILAQDWNDSVEPREQLNDIMAQLTATVQVTRTLVSELNPPVLETEGLVAALRWLSEHIQTMYHISVKQVIRQECEPQSVAVRTLLVQMTRELLFNVVKHARTGEASLILEEQNGWLHLHVEDRGVGFDFNALAERPAPRGGYGLRSIMERLQLVGGTVEVHAVPGTGSRVTLKVPVKATTIH